MNGYVEKDGKKFLWIGKRSQQKATYPGMLDHLVAGGLVRNKLSIHFNRFYFTFFQYFGCRREVA